jgi:hypothetical protein
MTMLALSRLALAAAVVATSDAAASRRLELTDICRYSPDTKVTDENALDLVRCFFATVDTTVAGIFFFSTHIYRFVVDDHRIILLLFVHDNHINNNGMIRIKKRFATD